MASAKFARPAHNEILATLRALDAKFLEASRCYFGGGTRIVLELGEYRESKDVDFLCADVDGYRALRETVGESSLGAVSGGKLALARQVRADQYGVRTFVQGKSFKLKLEFIREARIALEGVAVRALPVRCLSRRHCFAEKFMANADRGLDASTLARDAADIAFMMQGWGADDADSGIAIARVAYGADIDRKLSAVVTKLRSDKAFRARVVEGLAISESKALSAGLEATLRLVS